MKPDTTRPQAGSGATPRRAGAPRSVLVIAGIIVGLLGVMLAMFECSAVRRSVSEDTPPAREASPARDASRQRAPAPTARTPAPRPVLPESATASAAPVERPSTRAETKLVLTQMKVQKYVDEAYPAWRRAHPDKECPRQLIELNEYMEDKDANDAWGRPLRMLCGAARPDGTKGIKVTSRGRDGETSEDDIKFGP